MTYSQRFNDPEEEIVLAQSEICEKVAWLLWMQDGLRELFLCLADTSVIAGHLSTYSLSMHRQSLKRLVIHGYYDRSCQFKKGLWYAWLCTLFGYFEPGNDLKLECLGISALPIEVVSAIYFEDTFQQLTGKRRHIVSTWTRPPKPGS